MLDPAACFRKTKCALPNLNLVPSAGPKRIRMQILERRITRRLIMKVPLKFRPAQAPDGAEKGSASMNICHHGVYFATDQKLPKGVLLQVHLKLPREVAGDDVAEWCFTGRVAHVEPLGDSYGKSGVGVQFLCYEVPRAVI